MPVRSALKPPPTSGGPLLDTLPVPPPDAEKYLHVGRRRPWLPFVQLGVVALVAASTLRFVANTPYTELLLLPLAVSVLGALLSFVTTVPHRRDSEWSHDLRVALHRPSTWPSVDVFLPSCGEDLEVVRNTCRWVSRLRWPGRLAVHVLDDSARPEVAALSREFGFVYHSRPERGHLKKAGNLQYGFERTTGDLIAIFDADFCPRADFLAELVPYFEEPDVGIVQSPQYFDVDRRMSWIQRTAAASQEYFYRWVQPARDRVDAAICVGTNAVYRRAALERTGGFARIDHSEDVYTGVSLTEVGYRTRYVPVILAKGLCPERIDQFVSQQYRWCAGSLSLLLSWRFHRSPMSLRQRLCFWAGFLYYVSTVTDLLLGVLPVLLTGILRPRGIQPASYLLVALAALAWLLIQPIVTARRGRPLALARAQVLCSFAHLVALWDTVRRRPAGWVPTGAGARDRMDLPARVDTALVRYHAAFQVTLWTVLAVRVPGYGMGSYWPLAVLAVAHLVVVGPLLRRDEGRS
ncbi:MAG: glycosyltransferase [Actinomycetales bacterium]|nr:glycosyltransferase [Actinomycetales bacterium]